MGMTISQAVLDEFVSELKNGVCRGKIQDLRLELCSDEEGYYIYLVRIQVKKSQRRKGYGGVILDAIIRLADSYGVRVMLWATDIFGTNLNTLYEFYRKHGFFFLGNENDGHMIYVPSGRKTA